MVKIRTTITIDKNLLKNAKKHNIRISTFLDKKLQECISMIDGGKLLNPDRSLQYSCRTFYTLPTILLRRTFLGKLFPNSSILTRHLMSDWDHNSVRDVDWVLGVRTDSSCLILDMG